MPTSQDIKDRLSLSDADRPYQTADERADSLRGKIGLGRSQDVTAASEAAPQQPQQPTDNTVVNGGLPMRTDVPPNDDQDEGAQRIGAGLGTGGLAPDTSPDTSGDNIPQWPADVTLRKGFAPGFVQEQRSQVTAVNDILGTFGRFKDAITDPKVRDDFYKQMKSGQVADVGPWDIIPQLENLFPVTFAQRQQAGLEDKNIPPILPGIGAAASIERAGSKVVVQALEQLEKDTPGFLRTAEQMIASRASSEKNAVRLESISQRLRAIGQTEAAAGVDEHIAQLRGDPFVEIDPKTGKPTPETTDTVMKPTPERKIDTKPKSLQMPDQKTPPTEIPRKDAPIVYPSEENLGIPKADMESLPANLRQILVDEARSSYDEIQQARGGVVSRSQVDLESEKIVLDAGILAQTAPRTPLSAPGVKALRRGIRRIATEREAIEAEANALGPNVTDEVRARFAVKVFEQNSFQRVLAGGRAEWGRTGQAFQDAVESGDRVRISNMHKQVIKALGGKPGVDEIMKRLDDIKNDPALLGQPYAPEAAQMKYIHGLTPPTNWAKLREAFVNGILSQPPTHIAYIFGQAVYHEVEALAKLPTAAVDEVVSRVWKSDASRSRYTFNQALAGVAAAHASIPKGVMAGLEALKTGMTRQDVSLFGETGYAGLPHALQGSSGAFLRLPTRVIGVYTAMFHEVGRQTSLFEQAVAKVESELPGLSILSPRFRAAMSQYVANPTAEMERIARAAGQRSSLRGSQKGIIIESIRRIRDAEIPRGVPLLGGARPLFRVEPFVNIGINIFARGLEYSPLGIARMIPAGSRTITGAERSAAIAKAGIGTMIWKVFWDKAEAGEMTGAVPSDPHERAQWQREGKTPYSLKMGGVWYPIDKFEPIASTAKWMAGFNDIWKEAQGKPFDRAVAETTALKILGVMGRGYADMSWMVGISQIMRAMQSPNPESAINNYIGQQVGSQVPFSGFGKQVAQKSDPYVRSPSGIEQQIEATIPGLSALAKPSMDVYGQPIKRPESQQGVRGMVDPTRGSPEHIDPVDAELSKHQIPSIDPTQTATKQIFAVMAQKEIGHFKLTPEEGAMVQTLAGRATHQQLTDLFSDKTPVNGKKYSTLTEPEKLKAIQKTMSDARSTARAVTADAIMHSAKTPTEVARAADMRISLISARYDRSAYLDGLQHQGKLDATASRLINEMLKTKYTGSPTVAEYLKAAPTVRKYLAAPAFDQGNAKEWDQLKTERSEYNKLVARDKLDGTNTAQPYFDRHPLLDKYKGESRSSARQDLLDNNPSLAPFVGGATYVQEQ